MENWCRAFDRSLRTRLDDAYRDYIEAIEIGHETAGYQDDLTCFYLDHRQRYAEALESVECALAESRPGAAYEDLVLHMLKAEICAALGNWTQTLSGLEHVTGVLRHFLLDIDWHASAHTSPSGGADLFGEQIRSQLLQCIQASDRLTRNIGPGALRDRAMGLLTEQGRLRMLT
jgi:hypothetical protein